MKHRISVGALVLRNGRLLLARHRKPDVYDFWAPPGGGVEGPEEQTDAVIREAFEETRIRVAPKRLAYIDELIDDSGRMVKFWYLCDYVSGEIDVGRNPAEEAITEAGWFGRGEFPKGHVFPEVLHDRFWEDLAAGAEAPVKLPLQISIF
ncbi:NUDIX domain-containing protein [Pseudoruegeria sp. HB172150]|uniref:NUDIX domain-containing protein n=1 Tax=Pseudoruegeria sp. HB172150 TaxID=2721164 RepID=UPI001557A0F4